MYCPNCSFDNPGGMVYCGSCGTQIAKQCPSCQSAMPLDFRFCGKCGSPFVGEMPLLPSASNANQLHSMGDLKVPVEGKSVSSPPQLIGERRQATVLIADVKSSTVILERIGGEAWVAVMNQVLQIMGEAVFRFGGEVDQFRGDGIVAFFGARSAHEDDPERAILAALVMQKNLKAFAQDFKEHHQMDLLVRVGINTGEVITASIGSRDTHSEKTAMGSAITLAARLEALAEPDTILVSKFTYHLAAPRFNWKHLGDIKIKGYDHPMEIYRPLSPILEAEQKHRLQSYGRSVPMIGRDDELNTIKGALENLRHHVGGILLINGQAGLGKSRLIFEAQQQVIRDQALQIEDEGCLTWLQGRCRSYGHSLPDSMWVDLWQRWLGMGRWVSQDEALTQLREKAQFYWGDQFEEHYPYLAAFLSLPLEPPYAEKIKQLDAVGLRHKFFTTVYGWLERMARKDPVVIVFAEVHWSDEASLELLRYCLPLCTRESVSFIVVYRPDRTSPVWAFQHFVETNYYHRLTSLELTPLGPEKSLEILHQMIGAKTLSEEVQDQILEKAAGNPYYLTELVRSLVDQGILVQDGTTGEWQSIREDIPLDLPDSLKSLLLARIDNLSLSERRVLQMAAVIGPIFWYDILEVLTSNGMNLQNALTAMQRAQLISERGLLPALGKEYAFSSTLIREAAYDGILSNQREELHGSVARYLEVAIHENSLNQYHGIIAYHYSQAGDCQKELLHTMLAAVEAQRIYANSEAIRSYQHALELMDRAVDWDCIPPNKTISEWQLEALQGLGQIEFGIGEVAEAEVHLRQAVAIGRQLMLPPAELTRLFYWLGEVLFWQNHFEEPVHLGDEGLFLLGDNNQSTEAALMNQLVAVGSSQLGDHDKFIDFTLRTAGFIQRLPYSEELRVAYDHIITLYAYTLKDVQEARRWLEILKKQAEAYQDIRALGEYYEYAAVILFEEGDIQSALPKHHQAIEKFNQINDIKHASRAWKSLGVSHLQKGDIEIASTCFDKALDTARVFENQADFAIGHWYKAQVLLCQGDWEGALASFRQAGVSVQDVPQLQKEWALSGIGRVFLARGEQDKALNPLLLAMQDAVTIFPRKPYQANEILSGLEQAHHDPGEFRAYSERYRQEHPELQRSALATWFLVPAEIAPIKDPPHYHTRFSSLDGIGESSQSLMDQGWKWVDPLVDCSWNLQGGLVIQAANERNLHHINRSAPRFVRENTITGDFSVQVQCQPAIGDRPSIGGLLIWQSDKYWFCLETGTRGPNEITLRGFLDNNDLVFGRGQLDSKVKQLRFERRGTRLSAFCSSGNANWFYAGSAEFSTTRPFYVGIHAIGHIHRMIYPGAYPEGSAIQFDEFWLW